MKNAKLIIDGKEIEVLISEETLERLTNKRTTGYERVRSGSTYYTGSTWDEVKNSELMSYIDVLVDGEYQIENNSPDKHWVGSSNQRVLDVPDSLQKGTAVLLSE